MWKCIYLSVHKRCATTLPLMLCPKCNCSIYPVYVCVCVVCMLQLLLSALKIENNIKLSKNAAGIPSTSCIETGNWLPLPSSSSSSSTSLVFGGKSFTFEKLLSSVRDVLVVVRMHCRFVGEEVCLSWSMSATHHKQYRDNLQPHEP